VFQLGHFNSSSFESERMLANTLIRRSKWFGGTRSQGKTRRIFELGPPFYRPMALIVRGGTGRKHSVIVINDEHRGSALWASFKCFDSGG